MITPVTSRAKAKLTLRRGAHIPIPKAFPDCRMNRIIIGIVIAINLEKKTPASLFPCNRLNFQLNQQRSIQFIFSPF